MHEWSGRSCYLGLIAHSPLFDPHALRQNRNRQRESGHATHMPQHSTTGQHTCPHLVTLIECAKYYCTHARCNDPDRGRAASGGTDLELDESELSVVRAWDNEQHQQRRLIHWASAVQHPQCAPSSPCSPRRAPGPWPACRPPTLPLHVRVPPPAQV